MRQTPNPYWWKWVAVMAVAAVMLMLIAIWARLRLQTTIIKQTSGSVCGLPCGSMRWSVKTLSDEGVSCVDFTPKQTTISWLVYQQIPPRLRKQVRSGNIECQVWQVTGRLIGFKLAEDHDFHIVLADLERSDLTMIVEIPDPACNGTCASASLSDIALARNVFKQRFGEPPTRFYRLNESEIVTVTGVGFFDFEHGQIGSALNGVELHPVIGFVVTDSGRH